MARVSVTRGLSDSASPSKGGMMVLRVLRVRVEG